ncbi:MAG: hypothetical protein JXK05_03890 [Campylobacterales bacterium]|nr:hypothetical protein [Campylobacterales bacterium]
MKKIDENIVQKRLDMMSDMAADAITKGLRADLVVNSVRTLIGGPDDAARVLSLSIQKRGNDAMFASAIAATLAGALTVPLISLK